MTAIKKEIKKRAKTNEVENENAAYVENKTTGLTTGAANRNVTAWEVEIPFCNNLLATGTFPHSQTGNKNPKQASIV